MEASDPHPYTTSDQNKLSGALRSWGICGLRGGLLALQGRGYRAAERRGSQGELECVSLNFIVRI